MLLRGRNTEGVGKGALISEQCLWPLGSREAHYTPGKVGMRRKARSLQLGFSSEGD